MRACDPRVEFWMWNTTFLLFSSSSVYFLCASCSIFWWPLTSNPFRICLAYCIGEKIACNCLFQDTGTHGPSTTSKTYHNESQTGLFKAIFKNYTRLYNSIFHVCICLHPICIANGKGSLEEDKIMRTKKLLSNFKNKCKKLKLNGAYLGKWMLKKEKINAQT